MSNALFSIAYHREMVASRRLAASTGIPLEQALQHVLQQTGTPLEQLIADRRRQKELLQQQAAVRKARKQAARANNSSERAMDEQAWHAWFDGSTQPNPGRMGIGGLLKDPAGGVTEISFHAGHGDSSEAEYIALIALLHVAIDARADKLYIYGDSLIVIDDAQSQPGKGARNLTRWREHAQHLLTQLPDVSLKWIPRHKNAVADQLSQQAAGMTPTAERAWLAGLLASPAQTRLAAPGETQ